MGHLRDARRRFRWGARWPAVRRNINSCRADRRIGRIRGRAAQTLVIFAALLLVGLLRSIPVQQEWVLGIELVALAVFVAIALIALDRLAEQSDSPRPVARTIQVVNPSTLTAGGVALAGVLMLCGFHWADFVLVPVICAAVIGGLTSAWLLLIKLTD